MSDINRNDRSGDRDSRRKVRPRRRVRTPRLERLEDRTMLDVGAGANIVTQAPQQWKPSNTNLADWQNGPMANEGQDLVQLYQQYLTYEQKPTTAPFSSPFATMIQFSGASVGVDVRTYGNFTTAETTLQNLGLQVAGTDSTYGVVDGWLPIAELPKLASASQVIGASPLFKPEFRGQVYQGVAYNESLTTIGATQAINTYNVNGSGVTIGLISDSISQYAGGLADSYKTGDLNPAQPVQVLQDGPAGSTDEGRAMAENAHDVAPGAQLAFSSAYGPLGIFSDTTMAQSVINLAQTAKARVIADDVGVLDDPFFQSGIIGQAIQKVVTQNNVSYFSAAGNQSPFNGYLSQYRGVNATVGSLGSGTFMNFNPNSSGPVTTELPVSIVGTSQNNPAIFDFQFDQPWYTSNGVTSQVNMYLLDSGGNVVASGTTDNTATQQPWQVFGQVGDGNYYVAIQLIKGPAPNYVEFQNFNESVLCTVSSQFGSAGSTYYPSTGGHSADPYTIGVGAMPWWGASPWMNVQTVTSEPFSSTGPVIYDLTPSGQPMTPQLRLAPDITAPDGGNTSFFYPGATIDTSNPPFPGEPASSTNLSQANLPTFFGTSSATPNAAAVAAMMLQLNPNLTEADIRQALISSTTPMNGTPKGSWDSQAGWGLIQAPAALQVATEGFTTTLISASPSSPVVFGEPVSFTATVTSNGGGTPIGTVDFFVGTNQIGSATLNGSGQAVLSNYTGLPIGTDQIIATYVGNSLYLESTSGAYTMVVNPAAPILSITSNQTPVGFGQSVTFTANLIAPSPSTAIVSGYAILFDGSNVLASGSLYNGTMQFTTSGLLVGDHNITLEYLGNQEFSPTNNTSTPYSQVVQSGTPTVGLLVSPLSPAPVLGQQLTLQATVTGQSGAPASPTGTVSFMDGTTVLATENLVNGVATYETSFAVGPQHVTAVYNGDPNYVIQTSAASNFTVEPAGAIVQLSVPKNYLPLGQGETMSASVTSFVGVPTGNVELLDGSTPVATSSIVGGIATFILQPAQFNLGPNSFTAQYEGDSNFTPQTSPSVNVYYGTVATTTLFATTPAAAYYGMPVTLFTVITSPSSLVGPVNGPVTFLDGNTPLGTVQAQNGFAKFVVSTFPIGLSTLTAVFGGTTEFAPSISTPVTQSIAAAPTTVALSSSINPSTYGQSVVLTAQVQSAVPTGGSTVTGTVAFIAGSTYFGAAPIVDGVASLAVSFTQTGQTLPLEAVYYGTSDYQISTSNIVNQTINPASSGLILSSRLVPFGRTLFEQLTISAIPQIPGASGATAGVAPPSGELTLFSSSPPPSYLLLGNAVRVPTGILNFIVRPGFSEHPNVQQLKLAYFLANRSPFSQGRIVGGSTVFDIPLNRARNRYFQAIYGGDANFGSSQSNIITG